MLIEFLGAPGSGKSTLSRRVASLLADRGLSVDEPTYDLDHRRAPAQRQLAKLFSALRFATCDPTAAIALVRTVRGSRQATIKDALQTSLNALHIASLASRRRDAPVVTILDQGFAQAVWSIAYSAREPSWRQLVPRIPAHAGTAPDLVVLVTADIHRIGERLKARTRQASRMDHLGDRHAALRCAQLDCEDIAASLRACGTTVLEVTNSSPDELTAASAIICAAIDADRDATPNATAPVGIVGPAAKSNGHEPIAMLPSGPRNASRESGA